MKGLAEKSLLAKGLATKGLVAFALAFGLGLAGCAGGDASGAAKPVDKSMKRDK